MDLSELLLKVNKGQAVTQLKSVQTELNKTGNAASSLKDTLKNIGVSIGLAALVKQSLQFNNELSSIQNKFNTIFGGKFNGVKELVDDFNLTNASATKMLTTVGQFTHGLGFASSASRELSLGLSKAAADFAAFSGGNAEDIAKKFGKALTGETGELKDLGIYIDTSSDAFKKLTAEIAASTGASTAQAKALAINKMLIEQTGVATGSAIGKTLDGFTQLSRVFDNIKQILAKVGQVLSVAFGPILEVFNQLLSKPLVQWFAAISITVGVVVTSINTFTDSMNASVTAIAKSTDSIAKLNVQMLALQNNPALKNYRDASIDMQEQLNRMSQDTIKNLEAVGGKLHVLDRAKDLLENRETRIDADALKNELSDIAKSFNENTVKPIELPATFKLDDLRTDTAKTFVTQLKEIDTVTDSVKKNLAQSNSFQETFVRNISNLLGAQKTALEELKYYKDKGLAEGFNVETGAVLEQFEKNLDPDKFKFKFNIEEDYNAWKRALFDIKTEFRQTIADFQTMGFPVENIKFFEQQLQSLGELNFNNLESFDIERIQTKIKYC